MRTLLTLVVEDAKVLPILRAIEHIGADQLDIKPIKERPKALPSPEIIKKRGATTEAVLTALADGPLHTIIIRQRCQGFTTRQIANVLSRLQRTKRIKKTKEGWRLNGS